MYLLMLLRYLYGITEAVVQRSSAKKIFLKISYNSQKSSCTGVSFYKVEGLRPTTLLKRDSSTRVSSVNFARFFGTPVLYNICDRMLLVLVRIGLVWLAANLSIFYIIDCKSSQYLTYWNAVFNWFYFDEQPNQRTNVDNAIQVITEMYLDIQTSARGNTGI